MSVSRRNRRKSERNKKERFVGLSFSLDGISEEELKSLKIRTRFNGKGFEALIETSERKVETDAVQGYRKESKPGFVLKNSNVISNSNKMGVHQNLADYDVLFGIDTNSKMIGDIIHHVGMAAQMIGLSDDGSSCEKFRIIGDFRRTGEIEKPENENWMILIKSIQEHENYIDSIQYGIVVDSDLGNISDYNNRKLPIINSFYLPNNFKLIYASSDIANDELTNQLISFCDKVANLAIDEIKKAHNNKYRSFGG